ncbi:hypothetical protein Dsin_017116 [Dipteronia sinensis]|uniref:HAT C-terminal dimerisation domain-containing protein n=1 Tax=Dipteronia sinensis TaxID=43782 RepID=A0AAE0AFU2_9ROSI|nr:hypothetical protein Dsin_017116 [Dipteronia sinensis]
MASNMISKFDQYWKDVHGVMAMASLLDPRFKLKLLEYFYPLIYGDDRALEEVAIVRKLCEDIFKDYQSRVVLQISNVDSSGISNSNVNFGDEIESLDAFFHGTPKLIARDILAIPISTVALESSFSTSGRIVSSHRNRLLPSTLEAIMCTQNWLWAGKRGNIVDGVADMLVDEENENDMTEGSDIVDG